MPSASFAALALALAMVGPFGMLARAVAERSQELTVRAAVGASPGRLVRLVTRSGLMGLVPVSSCRGLAALLSGASSYDLLTVVVVAIVVHAALTASVVLARRVGRVDPMIALRQSDFQETSARVTGLHL